MSCVDIPFARVHCAAWDQRREDCQPGTGCGWQLFNRTPDCMWLEADRAGAMRNHTQEKEQRT